MPLPTKTRTLRPTSSPAPARPIIEAKLKQVMRGDIKIGEASDEGLSPHNKEICIMQATAYVLGYMQDDGPLTDSPVCTSAAITMLMISCNDHEKATARTRGALKKVIPHIINTAPHYVSPGGTAHQLRGMPEYVAAEATRKAMIREKSVEWRKATARPYIYLSDNDIFAHKPNMQALLDFIIELANVAHFGQTA